MTSPISPSLMFSPFIFLPPHDAGLSGENEAKTWYRAKRLSMDTEPKQKSVSSRA
jgi:hypothetical protein